MPRRLLRLACLFLPILTVSTLGAFTVTRDANQPPVEKVVLFAKGGPTDPLRFSGSPDTPFSIVKDGSLQVVLQGPVALDARFSWTAGPGRPATFGITAYRYLLLTCRVEGADRQVLANGKAIEHRVDNLWLPVTFYDAGGNVIGSVNLASVVPGEVTPAATATLRIPLFLFTIWGDHTKPVPPVASIGFSWNKPRAPFVRDYRIVVDRISLAD